MCEILNWHLKKQYSCTDGKAPIKIALVYFMWIMFAVM